MINLVKKSPSFQWVMIICLIAVVTLTGCQQVATENPITGEMENPIADNISENMPTQDNQNQFMNLPKLEGKATVVMTVKGQPITIELDGNNAPITAGNFVDLVQKGIYDGLVFHRVVKEPQPFVVQGGDPQGKDPNFPVSRLGTGGYTDPQTNSQRYIPLEIRPAYDEGSTPPDIIYSKTTSTAPELRHEYGTIAMARSQMPDSASSQFYFTLADLSFLDGNYAVFGKVTAGMEVVENIAQGDRIDSAEVVTGAENLQL